MLPLVNFMDENAGYNKIFMAEQDAAKTTFKYHGAIGLYAKKGFMY